MKKRLGILGSLLLLAVLLAGCGSGGSGTLSADDVGTKKPTGEKSKWAVYWYCCGSDLESEYSAATADIEEMLGATTSEDVKVVVQTGGAAQWQNDVVDASKIERYEFGSDGLNLVDQQPQADMGEAGTLQSFLSFCQKNYPADNTMLLFWNHGGGSVSGVSFDENYDYDSLTLKELDTAIGSVYSSGQKLSVVGMDTCLMATLDNANIMKKYANYLVASEELEPGNGWEYTKWLSALGENPDISAVDLGKAICDAFVEGCEDAGTSDEITLSVTDLSKVDALVSAVDSMGTEVLTKAAGNSKVVGQFGRSARAAENYGGNNDEDGYTNMVDLGDLMKNADDLIAATDKNVLSALESAVVYKVNGPYRSQASGLSTYYSYDGDTDSLAEYAQVAASPNYTRFIQYSLGEDVSAEVSQSTGVADVQTVQGFNQQLNLSIDGDGYINLKLDPAGLDAVSSVTFDLIYMDDGANEMVFMGTDNDIDANWDTGVFKDNFRGVWGAMDGNYAYMEITYEGDDYNLYTVPIKLNGEETNMTVSYSFKDEKFKILGVSDGIDENTGMAERSLKALKKGDEIILLSYAMSMDDGNDELYEYESKPIKYKGDTQFEEVELTNGDYAYTFNVKDTTGKTVSSDYAYINYNNGDITSSLE